VAEDLAAAALRAVAVARAAGAGADRPASVPAAAGTANRRITDAQAVRAFRPSCLRGSDLLLRTPPVKINGFA